MSAAITSPHTAISEKEYRSRIWAWTMYDWANSAFATTILAAVLPIYFSQVAGATLPSAARATSLWSAGLSLSLLLAAIISPILGTVSDVMRGKKLFLAIFAGIGITGTALLVFVGTGDWIFASIVAVIGRIGFSGANVFYDALLPHVARQEDQDHVSAKGYAMGYLGGGILLAINVVMIQLIPGTWGARLSFLSVAIWWAVFSIPLFRRVPEPPSATARLAPGENVCGVSFRRLRETIRDIRQYKELFKFVLAFLIYVDGIGTIIGVAAIYGAELGFGSVELILALLLVQFVGIPFSLIFGRLPSKTTSHRPVFLAFILFNLVALPLTGVLGARFLPADMVGQAPAPFTRTATAVGEGIYLSPERDIVYTGAWEALAVSAEELGTRSGADYYVAREPGASYSLNFIGQQFTLVYSVGPDHGIWAVELDGRPYLDEGGAPVVIDAYNPVHRYGISETFAAEAPGEHTLRVVNTGEANPASQDTLISVASLEILPPMRESNLLAVVGILFGLQLAGFVLALLIGPLFFKNLVNLLDTKRAILLALVIYTAIAVWGYFLNSVIEFWFLAFMVAVVQGGSQALSRSLFSVMAPASKSGEFFGLFGVMEKFSAILGPAIFALAVVFFDSSRPAVLSIIVFFAVGGYLLTKVDVEEGRRVAQAEDSAFLGSGAAGG
jgi:MFS transporter, UMF1 family